MDVKILIGYIDPKRWKSLAATLQSQALNKWRLKLETAHLSEILCKASQSRPEVLLIEHAGEPTSTLQLLFAVRQLSLTIRTLVLHDGVTPQQTVEMIRRGASGALLKSEDDGLICKAIRAVCQGEVWFSRIALLQAVRHVPEAAGGAILLYDKSLTPREREILNFIGLGQTNKEIARQLNISDYTVKTHLHRIYVKLRLSGRYKAYLAQAVLLPMPLRPEKAQSPATAGAP